MMRRNFIIALLLLVAIATMAPVAYAQAPAAAPTPTFKINGYIDALTTYSRNVSNADGIFNRNDKMMYARSRGRFDIIGEVGAARAVLGLELDEVWGQTGSVNNTFQTTAGPTSTTPIANQFGTDGSFSLNTDVRGQLEIKWLYFEFPAPLIPVPTIVRLGAQPFATAASYKLAPYANGDFAGVNLYTSFTPTFKAQFTYVAVEENLFGTGTTNGLSGPTGYTGSTANSQNRGDDFATIVSPEFTPMKGLDIKPMFSWFHASGTTSTNARLGRGGINTSTAYTNRDNTATTGGTSHGGVNEDRLTVGVDGRYRSGPFSLDPSVYYQFGNKAVFAPASFVPSGAVDGKKYNPDINAWLVDLRAGYQLGPLLFQGLFVWSSGNSARNNTLHKVRYFQPLDTDTNYLGDWGTQLTSLGLDYLNAMNEAGLNMAYVGSSIGWDKYGRMQFGAKATYAFTPTLDVMVGANGHFTDQAMDRSGLPTAGAGITPLFAVPGGGPRPRSTSNYVGTEFMSVLSWRFAPGLAWNNAIGYMIMGPALDAVTDPLAGPRNTHDVTIATSRFSIQF
jgi:hypothetical protein